jgi:predicted methyltransferase
MLFNFKTIFIFFAVSLLMASGCSSEDTGSQSSMTTNTAPATATGANDSMSVYQAALADPRRPAEEVARDAGRKPVQVLQFFGVAPGQRVVDIGSGDGYFTRILSGIVGENGSVVANNSGRRASDEFREKYGEQYASYGNVELNFEAPEEISLPDNSVDVVLLSLTVHHWHHAEDSGEFVPQITMERFDNIRRILKPGGIFAVIDHDAAVGASRAESDAIHRIPGAIARADITLAGFVFDGESNIHANQPNDDVTVRWTQDPRDATKRIVHRYKKPL